MELINQLRLRRTLADLESRGVRLPEVHTSRFGAYTRAWIGDVGRRNGVFDWGVTGGVSKSPALAVLKSISELIERRAFREWRHDNADHSPDSTGFACMPYGLRPARRVQMIARENAHCEAIERMSWASWWQNSLIAASVDSFRIRCVPSLLRPIVGVIDTLRTLALKRVILVRPAMSSRFQPMICFYVLQDGGVVAGGACGAEPTSTLCRAAHEALMHALALEAARTRNTRVSKDRYEMTLLYFGNCRNAVDLLMDRLNRSGRATFEIPPLDFDGQIRHSLAEIACVHRCRLKNQTGVYDLPPTDFCY